MKQEQYDAHIAAYRRNKLVAGYERANNLPAARVPSASYRKSLWTKRTPKRRTLWGKGHTF